MTRSHMQERTAGIRSLIFLHIPKAAGTTLHRIIERQYHADACFSIDGANVYESIETFKQLSEPERESITCLKGHMPFGLHVHLSQPCAYVTILRDPVERMISHYYFVLRSPHHYLYEQVTSQNMTLEDYVRSDLSPELHNGQTKLLAGNEKMPPPHMLEVAYRNLREHFIFVGLTEKFDESLVLMKRRLGWSRIYYTQINVNPNRPPKSEISDSTVRAIERNNEKDLELYAFARQLFEESVREEGPSFGSEVKRFRTLNRAYGVIWPGLRSLYSHVHRIKSYAASKMRGR